MPALWKWSHTPQLSIAGYSHVKLQPSCLVLLSWCDDAIQNCPGFHCIWCYIPASPGICSLPGCTQRKYVDPANNRVHDFCGRSHAFEAQKRGMHFVFIFRKSQCIVDTVPRIKPTPVFWRVWEHLLRLNVTSSLCVVCNKHRTENSELSLYSWQN